MVLADLRFGLVLSESLCGVRMLIVDHCFLCNVCVLYIGVLDSCWFVLCTLYYMFCITRKILNTYKFTFIKIVFSKAPPNTTVIHEFTTQIPYYSHLTDTNLINTTGRMSFIGKS